MISGISLNKQKYKDLSDTTTQIIIRSSAGSIALKLEDQGDAFLRINKRTITVTLTARPVQGRQSQDNKKSLTKILDELLERYNKTQGGGKKQ